ncbi:uncharacterized protein LOC100166012 [Acyrthosiphon pisum]|uniref:Uncharacterized protein n=1 Tax=Acyrthosiphon pisum TaxID=7029 RepID=A0A8R2B8P1_ACYPI|nr:uncharacterized protein LOC100166012 [Acyrthosiphon pisum]XP_029347134.1 uncharacterized protein LOC100166012 [Acyrthosiphon pisum]|eukprot:XP_008187013.1 PREDICTED: uncharacterized protein LOC100166012 [Acyrthosiphon pisum]
MQFNNYHDEAQKTDRDAPPPVEGRMDIGETSECKPRFGRHDAHKRHDTMGEIVQSGTDTMKFKYNHDNDFVDSRFKELIPHPEVVGELQTDKYGNSVKRDLKFHHSTLW